MIIITVIGVWDEYDDFGVSRSYAKIIINDNLSNFMNISYKTMNISSDIKSLGGFAVSVSIIQNNNISLILVDCRDLSTNEYSNIK